MQPGYDGANLTLCESLYAAGSGAVTAPRLAYRHGTAAVSGDGCSLSSGSAVAGLAFASAQSTYPVAYNGALFVADHNRNCIWAMRAGADGVPSASLLQPFMSNGSGPVDLEIGPGGDLFYAGFDGGRRAPDQLSGRPTRSRLRWRAPRRRWAAHRSQSPSTARVPPIPTPATSLSYAWDLDGDGEYDDAFTATATWTYAQNGTFTARLRVTDGRGASATDAVIITVGNTKPTATIEEPTAGTTWRVGQTISFRGSATDPEQGTLPASALSWTLVMKHCSSEGCHEHVIQTFPGATGSFSAPDHEYPSYLELELTATDAGGLKDVAEAAPGPAHRDALDGHEPLRPQAGAQRGQRPRAVQPDGHRGVGQHDQRAVTATRNKNLWAFHSWSDGDRAATRTVTANASTTYSAAYKNR